MGAGRKTTRAAAGPMEAGPTFGEEVHRLRRQKGKTLDELAAESGLSRSIIHDVEKDRYAPSVRTVDALAELLAPSGRADALAALAAETYRKIELDLAGLDRDRIEVVVQIRKRIGALRPEAVQMIRSALASAG